jgi:gamma-glutamyltranspeptidase/glutathione hydrolase
MVVTAQHLATKVGVNILKEGGNAVDAAVAVGYALAVVQPCCGNIGGGGFMLIRKQDGQTIFLNFREKAPLAASKHMYLNQKGKVIPGKNTKSWQSIGVPGTVMGLNTALKKYGTMTRKQVMTPAIKLAKKGFVLKPGDIKILNYRAERFSQEPNVAAIFLNHGKPYQVGDRLVQKKLAHSLTLIEQHGSKAFYQGPIAKTIVRASKRHGGLLTMKDFRRYTAEKEKPIRCRYRGYGIISSPPPSSGGTAICEILNVLDGYPMARFGFHSVKSVHYMVEAMRHAFADRNLHLGDPDFVDNPIQLLLSKRHAKKIRSEIKPHKATPSSKVTGALAARESNNTTHYSIVDKHGNAVAVTYTLNWYFGSGHIAGDTGFFLNNEMDDFTSKLGVPNSFGLIQGKPNRIAPGKRPLSSMSPTIVTKNGKLFMVTGSPGGSRIITITLESIRNVIDYGMNMQAAVDAPRIHQQWLPDVVYLEPHALTSSVKTKLEKMGYHFKTQDPWGAVEAILVASKTGLLEGANDDRRPAGLAAGY